MPVDLDALRAGIVEFAFRIVDEGDAHLGDAGLVGTAPCPASGIMKACAFVSFSMAAFAQLAGVWMSKQAAEGERGDVAGAPARASSRAVRLRRAAQPSKKALRLSIGEAPMCGYFSFAVVA